MPSRRTFVAASLAGVALSALPTSGSAEGTRQAVARRRILVFDVNERLRNEASV